MVKDIPSMKPKYHDHISPTLEQSVAALTTLHQCLNSQ